MSNKSYLSSSSLLIIRARVPSSPRPHGGKEALKVGVLRPVAGQLSYKETTHRPGFQALGEGKGVMERTAPPPGAPASRGRCRSCWQGSDPWLAVLFNHLATAHCSDDLSPPLEQYVTPTLLPLAQLSCILHFTLLCTIAGWGLKKRKGFIH